MLKMNHATAKPKLKPKPKPKPKPNSENDTVTWNFGSEKVAAINRLRTLS
jgi:hypothetical protein